MPLEPTHRVFVDFENVPDVDLGLVAELPVHVTLLIGKNQTRLATSFSLQLHRHAAQVEPVEVGGTGRNALDLTLACYLGQAVQQWPGAHFHIVSRDRDFEPMIAHLAAKSIKVARYDSFSLLPFLKAAKGPRAATKSAGPKNVPAPKPPSPDRCEQIIARLKNPANRNRPSTRKALLAHIKTALGKQTSEAKVDACLSQLEREGVVTIDERDRVTWA